MRVLVNDLDEATQRAVFDVAWDVDARLSLMTRDFEQYHSPPSGIYKEMRVGSVRL